MEMHGRPVDISPYYPSNDGHEAEIAHFVECLVDDKEPLATADRALDVMKILDGIHESSETGMSMDLT
jgi:predicted dehydrogenase